MIKLYQQPRIEETSAGQMGIFQVIKSLYPYLLNHFAIVDDHTQADVIISHAGAFKGQPLPHQGFISFCHGLHPTGSLKMDGIHYQENAIVIKNLIISDAVVVPSKWVSLMLERDMLIDPLVCHWGVNLETWQDVEPSEGYVLWNKNRDDKVCTSKWMQGVANILSHRQFLSTFGSQTPNVNLIWQRLGHPSPRGIPHSQMIPIVKRAGVYLATTKETGDIGSREALAAGVPVVAFAQGAVLDFLQHGVNGYLAQPDDIQDLAKGIEYCFLHRDILSQNARTLAQGYSWEQSAQPVIDLIEQVYAKKQAELANPLVSVIIPCHNYSAFVGEAIASIVNQDGFENCELIVIDDNSTDNSLEVIEASLGDRPNCKLIAKPVNQGVAQARNTGIWHAKGKYILPLDADDVLNKDALKILAAHLEANPDLGIAFGYIANMEGNRFNNWLTQPFEYTKQVDGTWNQVPTCAMYRREDALRVGLYRSYMQPAEDADLFTRLVTFTGKRAMRVTDNVTFFYRIHGDSLSHTMRRNPYAERGLPAWGAQRPLAAPAINQPSNPVMAYDKPLIQVEIVGEGDYGLTLDALYEQTFWNWTLEPNLAPLLVRVEAGKWLGKAWLQDLLADATLDTENDGISLYKVQRMACCGQVARQMSPSDGNLIKVRWLVETHNNPIPSWTGKIDAMKQPVRYRGNRGDEIYVFKDDYEYSVKGNKQCWEVVPEVLQLEVTPEIRPAPVPVLIPTMPEPLEEKHTVVIPEFSTLQNDEPAPASEKRHGRKPKIHSTP